MDHRSWPVSTPLPVSQGRSPHQVDTQQKCTICDYSLVSLGPLGTVISVMQQILSLNCACSSLSHFCSELLSEASNCSTARRQQAQGKLKPFAALQTQAGITHLPPTGSVILSKLSSLICKTGGPSKLCVEGLNGVPPSSRPSTIHELVWKRVFADVLI